MTRWDRLMLCNLLVLGMALSPLIYAQNAARMLGCCSSQSTSLESDSAGPGGMSCHMPAQPDPSETTHDSDPTHEDSAPACDMSVCCAAARAPMINVDLSTALQMQTVRITLPDSDTLLNTQTLRPDPPPPRA